MLIRIQPSAMTEYNGITVEHNGIVIEFDGSGKVHCGKNTDDLFECFNEYLKDMPEATLDRLFELYSDAKMVLHPTYFPDRIPSEELLLNNTDYKFLLSKLKPIITEIMDLIKPNNLTYFIHYNGTYLEPPEDLERVYDNGDYPAETTIDAQAYKDLVVLSLLHHPIFPVIADLLKKLEAETSKNYKETIAGTLIADNPWIVNTPGWRKLVDYVNHTYQNNGISNQRVEIISEDKYATHAIYRTLFTRFCCSHIPSRVPEKNLAKSLFSSVTQFDSSGFKIKDKSSGKDEAQDKRSNMEATQLKEEVNGSKEVAQAEYFSFGLTDSDDNPRYVDTFKYQCMGLGIDNPTLVEDAFELIPSNWEFVKENHMVVLGQLVYMDDVSPPIVHALEYQQLMCYLVLAQVKLHQMGYPRLAVLMTAIDDPNGTRIHASQMLDLNTTEREQIEAICDIRQGRGETTSDNEAVAAAIEFLKRLGNGAWQSTLEIGVLDNPDVLKKMSRGKLYPIELDREIKGIKEEFISLILRQNND